MDDYKTFIQLKKELNIEMKKLFTIIIRDFKIEKICDYLENKMGR